VSIVLRSGYTTGACSAAAAKAAAMLLCHGDTSSEVAVQLPETGPATFPILFARRNGNACEAAVRKDAGDDPDVTHQLTIVASVEFIPGDEIRFAAGEGVGTVTKRGLALPPGEPAINPAPRKIITLAVREVTDRGLKITISIPGGREVAQKTFNPRLGIEGGLSVLGTTGIVRPFSFPAMMESLKCCLDVAAAEGVADPVLVPGHIGERAAIKNFHISARQIIQVSNQWGFMLDELARRSFEHALVVGHPGKLAKMIDGEWDTHSSQSGSAVPIVSAVAEKLLSRKILESPTVEGIFEELSEKEKLSLGNALSEKIQKVIQDRMGSRPVVAVTLINLAGDIIGSHGDTSLWQ